MLTEVEERVENGQTTVEEPKENNLIQSLLLAFKVIHTDIIAIFGELQRYGFAYSLGCARDDDAFAARRRDAEVST